MKNEVKKKKVIVVGGGFAGVSFIHKLDRNLFEVLLIDKINHHQFQPLFYQVATSQIEPSSISFPLRNIFNKYPNVRIRLAEVKRIVTGENRVETTIGDFEYDYLVLAYGCMTNFFGNQTIPKHALTLKSTYDAITIRNHILRTFEKIVYVDEEKQEPLNNLVIVGAGPTGVELAGAFAEIKKNILPKDYHRLDFSKFTIWLIEGSENTLNNLSTLAQTSSKRYLENMGVKVITKTFVKDYDGEALVLSNGDTIIAKTVIWTAGVTGNRMEGLPAGVLAPGNRIRVDRLSRMQGSDNVFALGDIAMMETPKYPKGHPQVANVAITQAKRLAKNLKNIELHKQTTDYEYIDLGSMATIGRNKAVVDLPFFSFKGYFAWLIWMFLHLMKILSVKNRFIIFINWAWAYITKDTSLRLILTPEKTEG